VKTIVIVIWLVVILIMCAPLNYSLSIGLFRSF